MLRFAPQASYGILWRVPRDFALSFLSGVRKPSYTCKPRPWKRRRERAGRRLSRTLKNHRTVACLIYLPDALDCQDDYAANLVTYTVLDLNFLGEDQDAQTEVQSVVNTGKQPVRGSLHGDRSWLVSWSRWGKILSIRSIKAVRQNRCQAAKTEREGGREGERVS